ncbi:hypothetical protein Cgig2_015479 [Carnegiea gigantea]|uniref:Uncharacterized protein n=1 Tax=Carnegiea gigantea TaxID=171969 RepID=A0A9Q1JLX3_9CARY|nr:hypothetical protein Cgig2_015479 [Carnegiea gigantea]
MFTAFLSVASALGTPPYFAAMVLSFLSNLMGGLTHYGMGSAPVFYGANYVPLGKWWGYGFLISVFINILIWLGVGRVWWKAIDLPPLPSPVTPNASSSVAEAGDSSVGDSNGRFSVLWTFLGLLAVTSMSRRLQLLTPATPHDLLLSQKPKPDGDSSFSHHKVFASTLAFL